MRKGIKLLFTFILFTATAAWAVDHTPVNKDGKLVVTKHPQYYLIYCPRPYELVKDKKSMHWTAPEGWKSYEQSFATKITGFTVAQWQGINVGQATCVYSGTPKGAFPILMLSNKSAITPVHGKWNFNKRKHYSNCVSNSVFDCPIIVEAAQPKVNVYDEALKIKQNTPQHTPAQQGF